MSKLHIYPFDSLFFIAQYQKTIELMYTQRFHPTSFAKNRLSKHPPKTLTRNFHQEDTLPYLYTIIKFIMK